MGLFVLSRWFFQRTEIKGGVRHFPFFLGGRSIAFGKSKLTELFQFLITIARILVIFDYLVFVNSGYWGDFWRMRVGLVDFIDRPILTPCSSLGDYGFSHKLVFLRLRLGIGMSLPIFCDLCVA